MRRKKQDVEDKDRPLNAVLQQRLEILKNPLLLSLVRQTLGRVLGIQAVEKLMRPAIGLSGMPYLLKVLDEANIHVDCTHGMDGAGGKQRIRWNQML